jgi:hypothetical protein
MGHELIAFLSYYGCSFLVHLWHLQRKHKHLPDWAQRSRAHKVAGVIATVGTAAGTEGVQGYVIHLLVYSGLFF